MNENNYVGKNIKLLREKFKLSQEQLANKLEVSSQAVSKWENGDAYPSIETLVKMSKMFYTSVDSIITDLNACAELDDSARNIDFKLKHIYIRYNRKESIGGEINDVVALIIPLYNSTNDYFWVYSARVMLKATLYAMLEDKETNENNYNLQRIKDILQFANIDNEDRKEKITQYFNDKSKKCKELSSVYIANSLSTSSSILSYIIVNINTLTY